MPEYQFPMYGDECPFCWSPDTRVTAKFFRGEIVCYCPNCDSNFGYLTLGVIVWVEDGGDDIPDER